MRNADFESTGDGAFTADSLCAAYAGKVSRFAALHSPTPPDAEDLAQEALLRACRRLASFDSSRGTVEAWLFGIVANAGRDADRVRRRQVTLLDRVRRFHMPAHDSVEVLALERFGDADLVSAIRTLPLRARTLLALRYGADLDYESLAKAVGMKPGVAARATTRAVEMLRTHLARRK